MNIARRGDAGELETCVAWYVGEYANFLAAEYAWESAEGAETIGSETDPSSDGSAVARASPIAETDEDVLARASARNPPPRRRRRRDATLGVGVAAVDDQDGGDSRARRHRRSKRRTLSARMLRRAARGE